MLDADRDFLTNLFDAAIAAADPAPAIARILPPKPKGRTIVVGAGKGAAQMAAALEDAWHNAGNGDLEGCVVTRYGFGAATSRIEIMEAAHPVPDEAGARGAKRLLELVSVLTPDDLVIALIAGGGSALLPAPPEGVSLDDEIAMNEALLASGAPISAMNTVRKHVSRIKGGRLAMACAPARVVSMIVSDIPGDNLAYVASGPTVADAASVDDALSVIAQYKMDLPPSIIAHLNSGSAVAPFVDTPQFARVENHLIASAGVSLEAAAARAKAAGIDAVILSDAMEGEAREVAKVHSAIVKEILLRDRPFKKPVLMLSGGELTVTIANPDGVGGPSTEFCLASALELDGVGGVSLLCADTDGIDGRGDNAGAFVDGSTALKMIEAGAKPQKCLAENRSHDAFSAIGDLFKPGPTGTNVNDFRAFLIKGSS